MKIYAVGISQLIISALKDIELEVISLPKLVSSQDMDNDSILFVSSDIVDLTNIEFLREQYKTQKICYYDNTRGINKARMTASVCSLSNIQYFAKRSTLQTFIDFFERVLELDGIQNQRIIGVFGTGVGVGSTTISKQLATRIHSSGQKVIHLGLNLYDPGFNEKHTVSLDNWRPKLTAKIIRDEDFQELPTNDGVTYLPGNFDFLSTHDYQEEEIEYLLRRAGEMYDVVVADFGSIAESAAWFVGVQRSAIKIMVTQAEHYYRVTSYEEIFKHLDISLNDFFMVFNRGGDHHIKGKDFKKTYGMNELLEYPQYMETNNLHIPLGKKELIDLDEAVKHLLVGLGVEIPHRKRGGIFK